MQEKKGGWLGQSDLQNRTYDWDDWENAVVRGVF